jgi:hypothetical protein
LGAQGEGRNTERMKMYVKILIKYKINIGEKNMEKYVEKYEI